MCTGPVSDVMDPDPVRFRITMVPAYAVHVPRHYAPTGEAYVDKLYERAALAIEVSGD